MSGDALLQNVEGGIAAISLNQPDKLNPLGLPLQRRLREQATGARFAHSLNNG